ncbi:family 16 glycoside hydrolase [Mucilaginibacter sp. NFX135]|uniref:family 16 glycoside hydrolase n=1 Tax=Mucilaginibacter sp. NFX135 TaxID=3402687 RepID=UPI003AFAA631
MYNKILLRAVIVVFLLGSTTVFSQQRTVSYDLSRLLSVRQLNISNREAAVLPNHEKNGIMLSAKDDDGVALINNVTFSNGIIELDIRGKNADQQSFLGITFHAVDAKTLDAVYFRPFNFLSADSVHRIHMVQYVSHPQYPWFVLRDKFNAQYEKEITSPPDPNQWFHVRIEIRYPQITVFINDRETPCLSVKQLNDRKSGKLGLWVGNGSDGAFANLKVTFLE